jgi:hypothetical protein
VQENSITRWDREVPAEWQASLDSAFPPNDRVSWLRVAWHPGIARWVLYQMIPRPATARFFLEDEPVLRQNFTTRGRPPIALDLLSPPQRKLYDETGCVALLYWVIEGTHGGHQWQWDEIESSVSQMHGGPAEPPEAGSQEYAEFDQRVLNKVAARDQLRLYKQCLAFWERNPEQMDAEDREADKAMREEMWKWLGTQVDEIVEENRSDVMQMAAEMPRAPGGPEPDWEAMEEGFINTPI